MIESSDATEEDAVLEIAPIVAKEHIPAKDGRWVYHWDAIVRIFSDGSIDRSALGVLTVILSLLFGARAGSISDDPDLKQWAGLIDRADGFTAVSLLAIFFVAWFAGRIGLVRAPAEVAEWKSENNYVLMRVKQIEKDDVVNNEQKQGNFVYRQEQDWREFVRTRPISRFLMTALIRGCYLLLLASFVLIFRATYRFLEATILHAWHL